MTTAKQDVPYVRELAKAEAAIRLDLSEAGLPSEQHTKGLMILAAKMYADNVLASPAVDLFRLLAKQDTGAVYRALKEAAQGPAEEFATFLSLLVAYGVFSKPGEKGLWDQLLKALEAR